MDLANVQFCFSVVKVVENLTLTIEIDRNLKEEDFRGTIAPRILEHLKNKDHIGAANKGSVVAIFVSVYVRLS